MGFRSGVGAGFGAGCGCVLFVIASIVGVIALIIVSCDDSSKRSTARSPSAGPPDASTSQRTPQKETTSLPQEPSRASDAKPIAEPKHREPDRIVLRNYYKVRDGMTYDQVRSILGPSAEEVASGGGVTMLTWKRPWGPNAVITFQNGLVVSKAQFGLPPGEPEDESPDVPPPPTAAELQAKAEQKQVATKEAQRAEEQARRETVKALKVEKNQARKKAAEGRRIMRTWTSSDGERKTEAKILSVAGDKVRLEREDGTVFDVPLGDLSEADQEWIQLWKKNKQPAE